MRAPPNNAVRGACHLDQFGLAERATDWRGNNNIAESIIGQLAREAEPEPAWIVCGAGTGGTSATIGRYLRYRRLCSRLCVAEPAGSGFVHGWRTRDASAVASQPTLIEGIGRPRVEPGFMFDVVDAVIEVPDAASIAAAWLLEELLGRRYGGSSGTNLVGCLQLAAACARAASAAASSACCAIAASAMPKRCSIRAGSPHKGSIWRLGTTRCATASRTGAGALRRRDCAHSATRSPG